MAGMAMKEKDEVISLLRACLVSSKGGVSLNTLNRDFQNLEGYFIPYKYLGYPTLEAFLQSIPDIKILKNKSGDFMVQAQPNPKTSHIQKLVELQKSNSKTKKSSQRKYYNNYCTPKLRRPYGSESNSTNHMKSAVCSLPNNNYTSVNTNTSSSFQPKTVTKGSHSLPQEDQLDKQQTNKPNPDTLIFKKPNYYPNLSINIERSSSNSGNWYRWVNSSPTSPYNSNGSKSPPLPPSPPSPLSPQPAQGHVVEIEKAVYPPAFDVKDFTSNQGACNQTGRNQSSTLKFTISQQHSTQRKSQTVTNSATQQGKKSCVQKLTEYAKEHGFNAPDFKTVPIYEDKKIKYLSRVMVGEHTAFDPTARKTSQEEAKEYAANLMLQKFPDFLETEHFSMPITKDEQLMAARIRDLTEKYPNGVWASEIPGVYSKHYNECLCENWLALVEDNDMYDVIKWDNNKIIVQLSLDVKVAPLVPPSTMYWDVHITNVVSSEEVWIRIVGSGYSDQLHQLTEDMSTAKESLKFGLKQVHIGKYVLVQLLNVDNEIIVHRAQVLFWEEGSDRALCLLPDLGCQETIILADMACLPEKFMRLPFQAMKCSLKNLSVFRNHIDVNKYLEQTLTDRVLIALCSKDDTESERVIELFDTSTEEDVNLNNALSETIVTQLLIPSLPQGMKVIEVSVSCVLPTCEVFIQTMPCIVQYIEKSLQTFSSKILAQQPPHFFRTSYIYVTVCPYLNQTADCDTPGPRQQSSALARIIIKSDLQYLPATKEIEVSFVDYGWSGVVDCSKIKKLKTPLTNHLCKIPYQATFCKLRGVPPQPNLLIKTSAMTRLKNLVPPEKLVAMRISTIAENNDSPVIELFSRTQPENLVCSINDTIAMDMTLFKEK